MLDALQEFIDATAQGRPPQCGAAQWRRVQGLWDAVEESVSSGQAVTLKGPAS